MGTRRELCPYVCTYLVYLCMILLCLMLIVHGESFVNRAVLAFFSVFGWGGEA